MPYSSKKLQHADSLADKYQESFGGKYSSEDSFTGGESFNLKGMWDSIVLSRKRLGILLLVCVIIGMITLIKFKPKFIMTTPKTFEEKEKIDILAVTKYSFIIGFILSVVIFAASYRFPFIKNVLFKEEDCELCQA